MEIDYFLTVKRYLNKNGMTFLTYDSANISLSENKV